MTRTSRSAGRGIDQVRVGTPLPIGARLGDFEVAGVLHRGEFDVVYIGADRSLLHKVAIKEYLPATLADRMADGNIGVRSLRYQRSFRDGMQGFLSEARLLAALDEPALVKVLQFWEQHGTAYMAMPLYEGRTLREVLCDSLKPNEAWLKAMLGPLLDALATLHRSDCYACDVTPDSIVVSDGGPLLFDVGTARRIVARATEDVTVVLNPGYAPIEQYASDPSMPEGPWTDIYAVAAVLHLAIAGKPPPAPTTRIVSDTMPPLRDVTKDYSEMFLDAVDRGLAVRPEHRPQSIAEFRAALGVPPIASDAIETGQPASEPPVLPVSSDAPKVIRLPEPGQIPRVGAQDETRIGELGDGSKVMPPPSPEPEQTSLPSSSQSTTGSRLGGAQWKLVVPLFVVGLAGLGILVWTQTNTPSVAPDEGAATLGLSTQIATPGPEILPSIPMPTATAPDRQDDVSASVPNSNLPLAPKVPVAGLTSPRRAVSNVGRVTSVRGGAAAPAAPRTGKIQFSIKPWGQIIVDGKTRGVSPPIKELSIPEGRHRIEIRNSTFRGYASEVDIKSGSRVSIAHSFKSP